MVTVLFANRAYKILRGELAQMGIAAPGPKAASLLDLGNPELDWVKLAEGMGVPGSRSRTCDEFADQLSGAIRRPGPRLIEVAL